MFDLKKIFEPKYEKPSGVQAQAQKIVNICLAVVFFVGIVMVTMYAVGMVGGSNSDPIPTGYVPDSVKIMLVDEFMEWNGFQIATYDPSQYDPSVSGPTDKPGNGTPSKPSEVNSKDYMDEQYLTDLQKQVSKEDKKKIFNIITARLTRAEMQRFMELSKGGVTAGEKAEVKDLLKSRLKAKEIQQLKAIYAKYQ